MQARELTQLRLRTQGKEVAIKSLPKVRGKLTLEKTLEKLAREVDILERLQVSEEVAVTHAPAVVYRVGLPLQLKGHRWPVCPHVHPALSLLPPAASLLTCPRVLGGAHSTLGTRARAALTAHSRGG